MPARQPAKVTVFLEVKIKADVTDSGYLGTGATVQEHIDRAREDARSWIWLVKRGGTEPERVEGTATVISVGIFPEKSPNG